MTPAKFEIRENKHHSFDVYDNLDRLLPRWLATFKFFKDAKAFADARRPQASASAESYNG